MRDGALDLSQSTSAVSRFPGPLELFAAILLGRVAAGLRARELAARARAELPAASRALPLPAPLEALPYRLVYDGARAEAATHRAPAEPPSGAPWERAIHALPALRHRQRAALALRHLIGLPEESVAFVLGLRQAEAMRVILAAERALRRALGEEGEELDVAGALRRGAAELLPGVAGLRVVHEPDPGRPARPVVRALLAPEPIAGHLARVPATGAVLTPRRSRRTPLPPSREPGGMGSGSLLTDEVLLALEEEPPDLGAPLPAPADPARAAAPRRAATAARRPRLWPAIAAVAALLLSLTPAAGTQDRGGQTEARVPPVGAAAVGAGEAGDVVGRVAAAGTAVTVVVRRGDTLWDMAHARLGDGTRWREIWRGNRGRRMSDGSRFVDPALIRPGWRLRIDGRGEASRG